MKGRGVCLSCATRGCHYWGTLEYAKNLHMGPMCFASQSIPMIPIWNPYVFAICFYLIWSMQCWLPLMGPIGVSNNLIRGPYGLCPSKHPHNKWSKGQPNWSAILRPYPGRPIYDCRSHIFAAKPNFKKKDRLLHYWISQKHTMLHKFTWQSIKPFSAWGPDKYH